MTLAAGPQARAQAQINRQAIVNGMLETRWQNYFAQALRQQRVHVQRPPNLFQMLRADENGLLPDTPLVEYLHWRRSLNPSRFDRYHPKLAPLLTRTMLTQLPPDTPTLPTLPALPGDPDGFDPTRPIPQVPIPEPGTLMIALVLAGSFAWMRRRSERKALQQ